jgi:hypothetical protein
MVAWSWTCRGMPWAERDSAVRRGNIGGVERRVGYKGRNHRALDLIPDVLIEPLENLDHPYRRLARGVVDIERTWLRTCPPADPPTVPRDGSPPTLCAGASRP